MKARSESWEIILLLFAFLHRLCEGRGNRLAGMRANKHQDSSYSGSLLLSSSRVVLVSLIPCRKKITHRYGDIGGEPFSNHHHDYHGLVWGSHHLWNCGTCRRWEWLKPPFLSIPVFVTPLFPRKGSSASWGWGKECDEIM